MCGDARVTPARRALTAWSAHAGVFARPLGNVIYLMVTPVAPPATCSRLLDALLVELHQQDCSGDSRRAVVC